MEYVFCYVVMAFATMWASHLVLQDTKSYKKGYGVIYGVFWPAVLLIAMIAKIIDPPGRRR